MQRTRRLQLPPAKQRLNTFGEAEYAAGILEYPIDDALCKNITDLTVSEIGALVHVLFGLFNKAPLL